MEPVETAQRRRVVICDGPARHDIAAPVDTTVDAVLAHVSIDAQHVSVRDRSGAEIDTDRLLRDFLDGEIFTIIDPSAPAAARRHAGPGAPSPSADHAMVVLGVLALVLIALAPLTVRTPAALSAVAGIVIAAGGVAAGVVWVRRAVRDDAMPSGGLFAPLALTMAAGLYVAPTLAWGSIHVAVICAAAAVAVLAAALAVIATGRAVAAALSAVAVLSAILAALWALALLLSLSVPAACALTIGMAPVVLRLLPSTALSAAPGMFIDFVRFQTLRWGAREREPEPAHAVAAAQARTMVAQSSARWQVGTTVMCIAVGVAAPSAFVPLGDADPLTFSGRIALAACAVIALALQSRRALHGVVRWMPRAAVAVIVACVAVSVCEMIGADVVGGVAAVALLAVAVVIAVVIVPVGRGARSLRWSRVADMLESLTVALALPAGLLAAGVVDLLRGMMA